MDLYNAIIRDLRRQSNKGKATSLRRYFKTAPGEYGAGDVFWGLTVPQIRAIAREHKEVTYPALSKLLRSKIHEQRYIALLILVEQFKVIDHQKRKRSVAFYLKHTARINNWDLVDCSAPYIIGPWCFDNGTTILDKLAKSNSLWERRIAIVSTYYLIKQRQLGPTIKLCRTLLRDSEDLIQKACGWMLREVGVKDRSVLTKFLRQHGAKMPRTMLRYAIEHYSMAERKKFLQMRAI